MTFTVANVDAPVVFPIQIPTPVYRNQVLKFSANVVFSTCSENTAPMFSWRVLNSVNQSVFTGSQKILTVPQYSLSLTNNDSYVVELIVNTLYKVSAPFLLSQLHPIAVISGGNKIIIQNSGGRISAETSYDPNFGPNEQPLLATESTYRSRKEHLKSSQSQPYLLKSFALSM